MLMRDINQKINSNVLSETRTMGSAFEDSVTQPLGTLFIVFIQSINTAMQMKKLQFRPERHIQALCEEAKWTPKLFTIRLDEIFPFCSNSNKGLSSPCHCLTLPWSMKILTQLRLNFWKFSPKIKTRGGRRSQTLFPYFIIFE